LTETSDSDALNAIMERALSPQGIEVLQLKHLLDSYFQSDRSQNSLDSFRLSKRPFKKLRDEIEPVCRFLYASNLVGHVRFPLDSNIPDAWFHRADGTKIGIEVTSALGRADYEASLQLVEEGISGGLLRRRQNSATPQAFETARKEGPVMIASEDWCQAVKDGISECIRKKSAKHGYAGMILLVTMEAAAFPGHLWDRIMPELSDFSRDTVFSEIHVIGVGGSDSQTHRLK
jgi:hypothetical protein